MPNVELQSRVLKTLSLVPKGHVISYGQLADLSGLPGRARMMGKCLKNTEENINWHRVLRSDGKIAFPKGSVQAQEQRTLLQDEGVIVKNDRVNMNIYCWKPDLYTLLEKLRY